MRETRLVVEPASDSETLPFLQLCTVMFWSDSLLGVRMASLGLFLQCVTSVTFSILMERMVERVGARVLYMTSLGLLTFSTAVMTVSKSVVLVTAMAAMTGYTFSTLQILPYTLTCLYHSDKQVSCSNKRHTWTSSFFTSRSSMWPFPHDLFIYFSHVYYCM